MSERGAPIEARWIDAWRRPRTTPRAARDAVLASMALEPGELRRAEHAVHVCAPGALLQRVPVSELQSLNPGVSSNSLQVGQRLRVK